MSCNHRASNCICDTLKKIEDAQLNVNDGCKVGCELLLDERSDLDTIPILLICKGNCDYFVGAGVFESDENHTFECFKTPVFRVCKVLDTKKDSCCVELELLQAQCSNGNVPSMKCQKDVCSFFPNQSIEKFIRTGICLKVDVSDFSSVECLAAVNAVKEKPKPPLPPKETKIITEEICGNFGPGTQTVWEAPPELYVEGTFQIYTSSQSSSAVTGMVMADPIINFPSVLPGFTISRTALSPTSFTIQSPEGASGTYCIHLTKEIQINQPDNFCE